MRNWCYFHLTWLFTNSLCSIEWTGGKWAAHQPSKVKELGKRNSAVLCCLLTQKQRQKATYTFLMWNCKPCTSPIKPTAPCPWSVFSKLQCKKQRWLFAVWFCYLAKMVIWRCCGEQTQFSPVAFFCHFSVLNKINKGIFENYIQRPWVFFSSN